MRAVRAAGNPASTAIRRLSSIALGAYALGLAACASAPPDPAAFLARYDIKTPKPTSYSVCHGNGCRLSTPIILTTQEWDKVRAVFEPAARDAAEERARIAKAVGVLETLSGIRAGTFDDSAGTFPGGCSARQLDCEKHAVNRTLSLAMMSGVTQLLTQ